MKVDIKTKGEIDLMREACRMSAEIRDICAGAAQIPGIEEICLTTNGILLPGLAKPLKRAGVSRLNISLDTLDPEKFRYITRIGTLSDAVAGLDAALDCGFERIKVNAVLIGGFNDDEIPVLAELTRLRQLCCDPRLVYEDYDGGMTQDQINQDLADLAAAGIVL